MFQVQQGYICWHQATNYGAPFTERTLRHSGPQKVRIMLHLVRVDCALPTRVFSRWRWQVFVTEKPMALIHVQGAFSMSSGYPHGNLEMGIESTLLCPWVVSLPGAMFFFRSQKNYQMDTALPGHIFKGVGINVSVELHGQTQEPWSSRSCRDFSGRALGKQTEFVPQTRKTMHQARNSHFSTGFFLV